MSEKNLDPGNLMLEIDAIVQNSGKAKKLVRDVTRHVEIEIDKENSSHEAICGTVFITSEIKYLDNSVDRKVYRSNVFHYAGGELTFEKYDLNKPINTKVMKQIDDMVRSVVMLAGNDSKMKFRIDEPAVIHYKGVAKVLVICGSSKNREVEKVIGDMLFAGEAHSHVDTGIWRGGPDKEKCEKWAFLEIERRICNGETVIVSGVFSSWYELMPLAVIAQLYRIDMSIGRSAGKSLSIGNVFDINVVFEHFLSQKESLRHLFKDPYSAIEYFKNIDQTIGSLVIFPSILHKFFSER